MLLEADWTYSMYVNYLRYVAYMIHASTDHVFGRKWEERVGISGRDLAGNEREHTPRSFQIHSGSL